MKRPAFLFVLLLVPLAACATRPDRTPVPTIAFGSGELLTLEAETPVEIVEIYRAPLSRPNVEHEYGVVPAQIARAWVRDRVKLSGNGGAVRLTIHDASVVLETLPVKTGVKGLFRDEVDRRLTGTLEVQFDFVGAGGASASTWAKVSLTRSVLESAHPNEVEAIYFDLIQEMARGFDEEMARQVRETFVTVTQGPA